MVECEKGGGAQTSDLFKPTQNGDGAPFDSASIKTDLRKFYDRDVNYREASVKDDWKLKLRDEFLRKAKALGRQSLLEIGAGTGWDAKFFSENGMDVTAIDLSGENIGKCLEKGIDAVRMDAYDLEKLGRKFDCVWSLNCLLHVPKTDLPHVLRQIDGVLEDGGLFFFGAYGGRDSEEEFVCDRDDTPRFFSFYADETLKTVLRQTFEIMEFDSFVTERGDYFQAVLLKKRADINKYDTPRCLDFL
ncbi:MAG: class I SAM-dependent methyltransferase [Defluviitaleaceae bacterium]|nr:class I SAM-dependent methyltransferase [Defluviitaleaceae bacterium]